MEPRERESSRRFQTREYGSQEAWAELTFAHPVRGLVRGKHFLGAELGLTGTEVSLNAAAPGEAMPFSHAHRQNEELYLFLSGEGQLLLDGEIVDVRAGTAVRVAPPVMRCWRNTGTTPLVYLVVQAKEGSLVQATAADGYLDAAPPAWTR